MILLEDTSLLQYLQIALCFGTSLLLAFSLLLLCGFCKNINDNDLYNDNNYDGTWYFRYICLRVGYMLSLQGESEKSMTFWVFFVGAEK